MDAGRSMARRWAAKAEAKFDMECTYQQGDAHDTLCFSRPGVKGTLEVQPGSLHFHAQLGFLVSAFKERIHAELEQQLDTMLASFAAPQGAAGTPEPAEPGDSPKNPPAARKKPKSAAVAKKASSDGTGSGTTPKKRTSVHSSPATDASGTPGVRAKKSRPD